MKPRRPGPLIPVVALAAALSGAGGASRALDCNSNGVEDAEDLARGVSLDCNRNSNPDECDLQPVNLGFEVGEPLDAARSPFAAADLDGDGDLDLATQSPNALEALVLLNHGHGSFTPAARLAVAGGVRIFLAGDLNGDGRADLAAAGPSSVSVFLNVGAGEFGPESVLSLELPVRALRAGDLDGDGDLDLAALGAGVDSSLRPGEVTVLFNGGDGAFPVQATIEVGDDPTSLAQADLDGDSDLDLVVASRWTRKIITLKNAGGGSFTALELQLLDGAFTHFYPLEVHPGDLDGDGDVDLMAFTREGVVVVYRNQGAGAFVGAGRFDTGLGSGTLSSSLADLDGDRDLDFLALRTGHEPGLFRVLLNDGAGSFEEGWRSGPGTWLGGAEAADLDGDGDRDVIMAAFRGLVVHWNRPVPRSGDCNGNAIPDDCELDCDSNGVPDGCDLQVGRAQDCDSNGVPDGCEPDCNQNGVADACDLARGESLDCDRDGRPDECRLPGFDCNGNGRPDGCDFRDGTARDCNRNGVPDECDLDRRFALSSTEHSIGLYPSWLEPADLDADGAVDLIALGTSLAGRSPALAVLLNDRRGGLAPAASYELSARAVAAADLDRDGDLDLAAAGAGGEAPTAPGQVSILLNHGNGAFTRGWRLRAGRGAHSIAAADLDGDRVLDLAVGAESGTRLLRGRGDGSFRPAEAVDPGAGRVIAADLDGDGDLDLATDHGALLLNQGDGRFSPGPEHPARIGGVAAADLDGDGDLDLFSAPGIVGLNRGGGVFEQMGPLILDASYEAEGKGLAAGDLDGDGDPDLVLVHRGLPSLFWNLGPGNFWSGGGYLAGEGKKAVALADLDGDLDLDVAVANQISGSVSVLWNRGWGLLEAREAYAENPGRLLAGAAGDWDGDGDLDLVVSGNVVRNDFWRGTWGLAFLENQGDGRFAEGLVTPTSFDLEPVASGDLDGDGAAELIAIDRSQEQVLVLTSRGPDILVGSRLVAAVEKPGRVVAADLDGDEDLDLAVTSARAGGGAVAILRNQGGAFETPEAVALTSPPSFLAAVDLEGDGDLDLAVGGSSLISFLLNEGSGVLGKSMVLSLDREPVAAAFGDLDGDGAPDLVLVESWWDRGPQGRVFINSGFGDFAEAEVHPALQGARLLTLSDVDGDGDLDLALGRNDSTVGGDLASTIEVLPNRGGGDFGPGVRTSVGVGLLGFLAADLDGERLPDLAAFSQASISIVFNRTAARSPDRDRDGVPDDCRAQDLHRGDVEGDGRVDIADAAALVSFLFLGGAAPPCREASDADNDGRVELTDGIVLLRFLFLGGPPPAAPGPPPAACGPDPDPAGTPGDLGCGSYERC